MGDIVAMFAVMLIFGAPVAAWIISRVLAHQERMAMIRSGFVPPPDPRAMRNMRNMPPPPQMNMNPGAVPPPMPGVPNYDDSYYAQAALRKGIMVACIGLALFVGLSFIGHDGMGNFRPGPWLLGGLIPMFVGIAQIISALLSGARIPQMGGMHSSGSFGPPPGMNRPPQGGPGPSASQPPPQQQTGPYAWRPGSTPEIEDKH